MGDRVSGTKQALENMLFYYMYALEQQGVRDVKQKVATDIGNMITLSEEQVAYVKADIKAKHKLSSNLDTSIQLIQGMQDSGKIDAEAIDIIKNILISIKDSLGKAITEMEEGGVDG